MRIEGHAIEVRVNAEHPKTFLPSPGNVTGYHEPGGPGVRVDSAIHEHAMVQPYYDSLAAKLIVKGNDREHARRKILQALDEFIVEGIHTTIPLQRDILADSAFIDVTFWTQFVDKWVADLQAADD